jgi:ankyrin repeat protein
VTSNAGPSLFTTRLATTTLSSRLGHFAAQQYSVAVAELLLRHGADVAAENRYGNTPLGTAVYESRGRGDMIRLLLAHGADPDKPNHAGRTPAQLARLIANYPVAQLLEPPADTPKH